MSKITIIGTGSVGSTIAYCATVMGFTDEIVLIDINSEKAMGEALDIRQGVSFCKPTKVYAGSYSDAKGSDIVIITSGIARKPGQTRLELAQTNVNIIKSIATEIVKYAPEATYVIVSNPVDILTYVFCKYSGIPEERVVGSGTILDTARLRARIAEYYKISQNNVHAYILGEHGDTAFVPWSIANISNIPVEDYGKSVADTGVTYPDFNREEVVDYVRKSGGKVIQRKGATFYAVSVSVCHLCKCLLNRSTDTTLTVSTMLHGEYGVDDVCLSLLNIVGGGQVKSKLILPLNDAEIADLHKSADALKAIIKDIEI